MRAFSKYYLFYILLITSIIISNSCSSRLEKSVVLEDSTISFLSKKEGDINAKITFYKENSSNELTGVTNLFQIKDNGIIRANIELDNISFENYQEHIFHLDWIDSKGISNYMKPITLTKADTSATLYSSLSITPDSREDGKYSLKVYYFRELIAMKEFILLPEFKPTEEDLNKLKHSIYIYDKQKKQQEGIEIPKFEINNKNRIYANISLGNRFAFGKNELQLIFEWVDNEDSLIYKKGIELNYNDSTNSFKSSISIPPDKRKPGSYKFKLFVNNILIEKKEFILYPKFEPTLAEAKKVDAEIILYRKKSKKTGNYIGVGNTFTLDKKGWIKADIFINNPYAFGGRKLSFRVEWIGPDNKCFYKKNFSFKPLKKKEVLYSSTSASPLKKEPGNYKIRVYLFGKKIAEEKFILTQN